MLTLILAIILLVSGSDGACADPISALIVGAIGLTGTAATIGTAIVDVGLALGLSYAAKAISPQNKTASTRGQSVNLQISTNPTRKVPIGTVGTAGDLVYWQVTGSNNDNLRMVVAFGDLPCDSLDTSRIFVESVQKTIDGSGYVSDFDNKLQITFHNGDPSQSADSDVVSSSDGLWTSNEVGKYVCYAVISAVYDEKIFPSGIPQIVFSLKGAKLYDWRQDSTNGGSGSQRWADMSTWAYSDNPIVALYNVIRGIAPGGVPLIGMGVPAAALRLSDFTSAANACDETVALAAGGTEKRYRISTVLDTAMTNRDIIETILASCSGQLIESCGIYRPMVGVAQSSVASITDADLIVTQPFQSDAKRPRTELFNAVYASYSDPTKSYNVVPLPNRTSSDDEAEDGGLRLPQTLDLGCITSRTQAQRVMEIARKRARRQLIVSCTLRARWFILEPGDWITFNSYRRGYTDRVFEIQTIKVNPNLTSDVVMREVDAGIDDWSTDDELPDDTATDLASGGPSLSTVTGIDLDAVLIEGFGDEQIPGLQIVWTAITDSTVISLDLEYRQVGDTVALSRSIADPASASYTWVDGVQGGLTYEARLKLVTLPSRAVEWSAWVSSASASPPQIVSQAAIALTVPDGVITPAKLSAQARLELSMATASAALQGSVNDRVEELFRIINQAALASMGVGAINQSAVRITNQNLQTLTESFAQYQIEVNAAINDPVTGIPAVAASVLNLESRVSATEGGITAAEARVFLGVTVSDGIGFVTGGIDLYADAKFSSIGFAADRFFFMKPDGTGAKTIVTIGELADGSTGVGIDAEQTIIKGTVKAEHLEVERLDAISSHLGEVITGKLRRNDNLVFFDLDQGELRITTPQMLDLRFKVNTGYIPAFAH